ncbi:FkbM family methyltransferase [Sphingomonas sp. KRR8]|uniref:FkbM family methyltransferase n=1 Tax=Sphingomonas sp. KRR8 TaxID=2942996 RepID=UPI0020203A0A|nr:FkbM family methyltransferase [Sphingomonas sp. KRR8]URD61983.1 FkbM family methyltransferase [Sphingomonas sp. KRR8]
MALSVRDVISLLRTPRVALGTTVNDQLALPLLVKLCRPREVFLDVGAHIGSVIAEVQHQCPTAHIEAFEAIPEKAEKLRRRFPGVAIHSCALSEDAGSVTFYVDTEESGYSSLAERPHGKKIVVSKCRLDSLVDRADLIKIDVEGAELGVLRGSDKLIERSRPTIMFESGPGNVLGYTKEAMFAWFAERNYGLFAPNRLAGTGGAMTLDGFLDSHEYPRRTTNYFALPIEKESEIRGRA